MADSLCLHHQHQVLVVGSLCRTRVHLDLDTRTLDLCHTHDPVINFRAPRPFHDIGKANARHWTNDAANAAVHIWPPQAETVY